MIITFEGEYKSLTSFKSDDLGNFAIITGKNGSGKTQLIELTRMYINNTYPNNTMQVVFDPIMKNIQVEGIAIQNGQVVKTEQITKQLEQNFTFFHHMPTNLKELISELITNGLNPKHLNLNFDFTQYMTQKAEEKSQKLLNIARNLGTMHLERFGRPPDDQLIKIISNKLYEWKKALISATQVSNYKNKPIELLTKNDFSSSPILETYYTDDNPFTIQIESLLYGYARKRFYNELGYFRKETIYLTSNYISDEEFVNKFPPPWITINKILTSLNIKFRVQEIKKEDFSPEFELSFSLFDSVNEKEIKLEDLSSGEKIIVGLILRMFLTRTYTEDLKLPDCIILDEPDAFLHPEMSSLLIEVLYKTFVQELGIKVIFTTHSPSTVALTPEDCIFELKNGANTTLKKITKDNALKILTENLPLLSIDYHNHKQVFVESPTDQYYYQTVFNKLKSESKLLYDLYFITTGYGKSNCDQVFKLTKELRQAGNRSCFGIVDWDLTNKQDDVIYVHGFEKRYSIENFVLDPIYLCISFIEDECANGIGELGYDKTFNQYNLINAENDILQTIVDWIIEKLIKRFGYLKKEPLTEITYANGKKVNIPEWYLKTNGHGEIEEKLKQVFPSLNSSKNAGKLQKRMTEIMGKCYPLIPKESTDLIIKLSNS